MSTKLLKFFLRESVSFLRYPAIEKSPCLLYAVVLKHRLKHKLLLNIATRLSGKPSSSILHPKSCSYHSGGSDGDDSRERRKMKLMDFPETLWPSPSKFIRNKFLTLLIRSYYDETFSINGFLEGSMQAVGMVSGYISQGNFTELHDLVDNSAINEIKMNYEQLDMKQRLSTAVDIRDIFTKFIYEIGMIFDDTSEKRFVEITVVLQGVHGQHSIHDNAGADFNSLWKDAKNNYYVCNYRFIREFTKGVESEWIINKLNHFCPSELAVRF